MSKSPLRIIFFGPPGSGKGTQSKFLEKEFDLAHISTGDQFREEIRNQTPVGLKVKAIIEAGKLVDDETVMEVFEAAISRIPEDKGFILDGIPRTIQQCELLQKLLEKLNRPSTHVLYLNVDREVLKTRICGRLFHPGSGRTYHKVFHQPKVPMKDDITGEDLIIRKDDTEEVFNTRMDHYESTFGPCLEHYKESGLLREFNGNDKTAAEVYEDIKSVLLQ